MTIDNVFDIFLTFILKTWVNLIKLYGQVYLYAFIKKLSLFAKKVFQIH